MVRYFYYPSFIFSLCLLILSIKPIICAENKIDSLKAQLEIIQDDSLIFATLDQISWQYLQRDLDSAEKYNSIYHEQALKVNDLKYQATGFNTTGVIQWYRGNYDEALKYIKKALFINLQRKDTLLLASNYGNIGILYDNIGQSDSAIYFYQKAMSYAGFTKNFITQAKSHINLALLFTDIKNYQLALKHNLEAEKIYLETGNFIDLPILYNNIGSIYKIQKKSDSAHHYYSNGLFIADSL